MSLKLYGTWEKDGPIGKAIIAGVYMAKSFKIFIRTIMGKKFQTEMQVCVYKIQA
jgi:hypothetical protein